jgi:hypothetical protein
MSLVISKVFTYDTDAGDYIQRVEGASGDNQALEPATRQAINNFVIGCKQDGIWNAIKASCILSGARTLNGALQPLAGTAPTPFGFVGLGTDYVRKTGLVGNGTTKYLNSNRNNNADPQANKHISVYLSSACTLSTGFPRYIGVYRSISPFDGTHLFRNSASTDTFGAIDGDAIIRNGQLRFHGASRASASTLIYRSQQGQSSAAITQQSVVAGLIPVFAGRGSGIESYSNARLAFYSIGESLDLALLDARVTALITAFGVAIP